jgi:hypothetical protein
MSRLFLFAIGGTGSRVVKSLTMLMASGVVLKGIDDVVPIIIDPDSSNGDLTRTVDILKEYKSIYKSTTDQRNDFFKTRISSLDELNDENNFSSDTFTFDIDGVKNEIFKDFIGYSELSLTNKSLVSGLFSEKNLNADMQVGFKGNPNIGSVVLNKFKDTAFFTKFASSFQQNDRIFIISSIFGGTGAAGFPLILKNIRDADNSVPKHDFLRKSKIGAVTVLPYFGVDKSGQSSIDSNTFTSKTIAALKYYADNICDNKSINSLYYIGDNQSNDQSASDGSTDQKNKAHFVELASALSIVDFVSIPDDELQFENGQAISPRYFEYGLKEETNDIKFSHLSNRTYELIAKPLTKYSLFKTYMDNHYEESCKNLKMPHIYNGVNKLSKESLDFRLRDNINLFNSQFEDWIFEMKSSNVSFFPLDITLNGKNIYNQVIGNPVKKSFINKVISGDGLINFTGKLNKYEPEFDNIEPSKKLFSLFSFVTEEIVNNEIKIS